MTEDKLRRRLTGRAREGRTNAVPMSEEELQEEELDVAPPAYGEHHDQLQFSQAGFDADAAVTSAFALSPHSPYSSKLVSRTNNVQPRAEYTSTSTKRTTDYPSSSHPPYNDNNNKPTPRPQAARCRPLTSHLA